MSNTNNRYLEGTEFTNISVVANCDNTEDGSIEASGTLFVNTIREYDISSPGVTLEGSIFEAGKAIITSTAPALNSSSASLIVKGGISTLKDSVFYGIIRVDNTSDSTNLSTGSLIINGGISVNNNLNVGGVITLFNSTSSLNISSGSLISVGGISIQNTVDAISLTSGGALTIAGGVSIAKTLFANLINSNNATISNSNIFNLSSLNVNITNASILLLTVGNIISNNITTSSLITNNLNSANATINNLVGNTSSFSNVVISSEFVTNSTISNLNVGLLNVNSIISTSGNIDVLTVGNLHVTTNIEYNDIVTNLSTSNVISLYSTIGSLDLTIGTFGSLYGTDLILTNLTVSSIYNNYLVNSNLFNTNLTTTNVRATNETVVNSNITNATISSLNVSNFSATNLTSNNAIINNLTSSNASITNISSVSLTTTNLLTTYNTSGFIVVTGTTESSNSTTGTLISYGGISIDCTFDATSVTTGGALTVAGGASIFQDLYVGNNIFGKSLSVKNVLATNGTIESLIGLNSDYINSTVSNLYISGTTSSLNSTSGSLISNGGISINCTEDVTSLTSGGGFTDAGGASIAKSLIVGGTVNATSITASTLYGLNSVFVNMDGSNMTITSLVNSNGTITNLYGTNSSINNIYSSNINSSNASLVNITYGSLIGNYISANIITNNHTFTSLYSTIANLINEYSSVSNLQLTQGTFGNLTGSYININNASISSLLSTNIKTINETTTNLLSTNITTTSIISTTANFLYGTISNISTINLNGDNSTINNLNVENITIGSLQTLHINGTIPSLNSTTGTLIIDGGVSIDCTSNATSSTSGGSITINGGASIAKDLYIGGNTWISGTLDLNTNLITNVTSPSNSLDAVNKYYVDHRFDLFTTGNVNGNFTQGQVIVATTAGNIIGYDTFMYDVNTSSLTLYGTSDATSVTNGGTLKVEGGVSIDKQLYVGGNAHVLGYLDMNNQKITSVAIPTTYYDAANKYYVDNRFDEFTIGNVSGNFTQGQVIVASTLGNITGFDSFTFYNNVLSVYSTDEATNLTSGGVLDISGGARIQKSLYVGGPVLQIPKGDTISRPVNADGGYIRYNTETQQFEGFGAGNNWGSLGGVVDIAQTTKILASASPSTTDGNLYFYTVGSERVRINSSGNVGIGTSSPIAKLHIDGNLFVSTGIDVNSQIITNVTAPSLDLDVANKWYVDNRFNQFTIGNVSGNFTQGQVIVASTLGNITGYDAFTFYNNVLSVFTTDEATSLTSGGVLDISGGARIQKSLYVGGPVLQIPKGDTISRPVNADGGYIRYNTETQQFEGFGAGNNWGSLGGVVDIAQTTKVLASASPSVTDGNLYFYTVGSERVRINSSGNVGIGTSDPSAKLHVDGNLFVSTGIDANSQIITNVTAPTIGLDVANKWYVDNRFNQFTIGNVSGNFTQGQVIVASTLGNITGYDAFTFYNNVLSVFTTDEATSLTSGGVLDISGGARIQKSLYVGGPVLQIPTGDIATRPVDAVPGTVRYNSETQQFEGFGAGNNWGSLGGVVDIAQTTKILASASPSTTDGNLYFYTVGSERVRINSSGNVGIGTSAPSAKLHVDGNLLVSTGIDANSQIITNVTAPSLDLDVANKWYVDHKLDLFTIGNVTGNFTQGQVIVADSAGHITGFNNFMFDGTKLSIYTSENATGLNLGGVFNIAGGATISKDVYIGGKLDVNLNNITSVQDPYQDYDAVNKRYVDTQIDNIFSEGGDLFFEYNYELGNNVTVPANIPDFIIPYTSKAFIANVYINTPNTSLVYTLKGLKGSVWKMTSSFIGGGNTSDVKFYVNDDGINLTIQYTNTATTGLTSISYRVSNLVDTTASLTQTNIPLNASIITPANVPGLSFNNATTNCVKLVIYISSDIDSKYSLVNLNAVQKNGTWVLNTLFIGNVDTIIFNVTSSGQIQYTNSSAASDYMIRVKKNVVDNAPTQYTLTANTTSLSNVENLDVLLGDYINTYFLALVYVYLPLQNQYAFYEIEGVTISNIWHINTRFIGDNTGITFSLTTTNSGNYLSYTNPNNVNGYIRLINANPFKPVALPVSKGGTSTTYLNEYTILRGNGTNKILGTNDLIYKNNILSLGPVSSIVLNSTQNATNLTTGTLVSYGGISVKKDINVGGNLNVNNVNLKPSLGDIYEEQLFYGDNDQIIESDVVGFGFNNSIVRYFHAFVSVSILTNSGSLNAGFELKGIQTSGPSWILQQSSIGDDTYIMFSITNLGQIQYTSSNIVDWVSTTMKFRALTTSV